MEYMQCEYCGCGGVRVGFRGVTECCGCGAPSRPALVTKSMSFAEAIQRAALSMNEFSNSIGEHIVCSGMSYPEDDKILRARYGPNLTDESTDRVWG